MRCLNGALRGGRTVRPRRRHRSCGSHAESGQARSGWLTESDSRCEPDGTVREGVS